MRTDRHESNIRFSQFCERARPPVTIFFNKGGFVCHVHSLRLGVFCWRRFFICICHIQRNKDINSSARKSILIGKLYEKRVARNIILKWVLLKCF